MQDLFGTMFPPTNEICEEYMRNAQALALENFEDEEFVTVTQDHMENALFVTSH